MDKRASTSSNGPAAGGSTPASGTNSTGTPLVHGDGGAGSHLSEVVCSPSLSSSSDNKFTSAGGGENPCCSRSHYSSLCCSRCSRRLIFFSFARAARSCSRYYVARLAARARGVNGSDRAGFTVTICGQRSSRQTEAQYKNPKERRNRIHWLGVRKHHERLEVVVAVWHQLEDNRAPRPRGPVLLGGAVLQQP
jgi:hypothetical protein